jgi:hypothetical protein
VDEALVLDHLHPRALTIISLPPASPRLELAPAAHREEPHQKRHRARTRQCSCS